MNTLNFAVVSFFNRFNGYGYLIPSDGGPDVFFAYNEIRNARYLTRGQKVSYVIKPSTRKPGTVVAGDVTPIEDTPISNAPTLNAADATEGDVQ